jgi:LPXTG-motif cell wall-anchored protein
MFKKIVSIAIAAMMVASTAAIAASAAETDSAAVAAAEDSAAVAAPDGDSSVGADDSGSAAVGGNSISFQVDRNLWKNFKKVYCYLYEHGGDEIIVWGSNKGAMTDAGNDTFTFDFDAKGISIESGKQYGVIFSGDWGVQTCDIIFDSSVMGDTAYLTGEQVENNVDSNKKSYYVKWKNADASKYAPPLCITSIGNVIGEALWAGTTRYDLLLNFIKSDGKDGLSNALKFNGKDEQQTLDDTAKALGLGADDVEKAIKESGKTVKWDKSKSSLAATGENSGDGSSSSGDSSSNSGSSSGSSSSSSSGSSSSGSSSSGSSSVSSGQETTIFFVFGGVMLAAAGVIFLARKRRDF